MSFKTPWRRLGRHIEESSLPMYIETRCVAQSFYVCIYHSWSSKSSRLHLRTKNLLQDWRSLFKKQEDYPPPIVHQETWNFTYSFHNVDICHSWCSKSSRLYSGIKNVLKNSLEVGLDTHRRISSSGPSRDLKICTNLLWCFIMSLLKSTVM